MNKQVNITYQDSNGELCEMQMLPRANKQVNITYQDSNGELCEIQIPARAYNAIARNGQRPSFEIGHNATKLASQAINGLTAIVITCATVTGIVMMMT